MFVAILGREIFTAKVDSKSPLSLPYLGYFFFGGGGGWSVFGNNEANRPRSICFAAQGGNYTKSRPGGRWVEIWRQPRVSLILSFLVTFRYFVSEMVLTCAVSIYIICKYGNGEIFTQSEEENGSRHL